MSCRPSTQVPRGTACTQNYSLRLLLPIELGWEVLLMERGELGVENSTRIIRTA